MAVRAEASDCSTCWTISRWAAACFATIVAPITDATTITSEISPATATRAR